MNEVVLRPIQQADNAVIAGIIREALTELGANKPGTVYYDKTTDHLYELFRREGAAYFVAEAAGQVIGAAGIYPSEGLPDGMCELVKMYLKGTVRGKGIGRQLMECCLVFAAQQGYRSVYIETLPELKQALTLYERTGFRYLPEPVGNTGHFGCSIWMLKEVGSPEQNQTGNLPV